MNSHPLPLFASHVPCGFPSPADDYVETTLDLNELVIAHPEATFYARVSGDSMINAAICDGDILVIDRARKAEQNSIVLALLNEEFTVKRLHKQGATILLIPENPAYELIRITDEMDFQVWGVVTYCIHRL
jgi:DNA polymerase V